MTNSDLVRFVNAQTSVYGQVVEELSEGRKRTHWMWFIFPQLAGLGRSPTAQHYAIRDLDQAKRYLADPILGSRLRQDVRLLVGHEDSPRWKFSVLPMTSSFGPVSHFSRKQPPIALTGCCSSRLCTNSMRAQIPGPCSF